MDDAERYGAEGESEGDVVARLAKLGPIEFDQVKHAEAAALGCTVTALTKEVRAKQKRRPKEAEETAPDVNDLAASAAEIIECEDVFGLFEADWRRRIAGEEKIGKILLLAGTSRLLDKAISIAIKGSSSGGKSEVRRAALKFFPPESVVSFTSLSERALIYTEDDFAHKILSMGEAAGSDEQSLQDYLLRELLSEGALKYHTVRRIGDDIQTIVIEKHGPVAFLVTTTRRKLHPENETRMLSLDIDDSEEQTRAVLNKVAAIEGLNAVNAEVDFTPWQDFQRWLETGECVVVVPYAEALARAIPPRSVRLRRDLGQVLRAIKAHALLHRQHRERDERGAIVADIDRDYAAVRALMNDLLAETSEVKIKETVVETINAVEDLTRDMGEKDGTTAKEVGRKLKLDKSAARRRLLDAMEGGYVVNLEDRKGHPGKYRTADETADAEEMMPTPEALAAAFSAEFPLPPVPPCHRNGIDAADQTDSGGNSGGTPICHQSDELASQTVAKPETTAHATAEARRELPNTEGRWHGGSGGKGVSDGEADYEREERAALMEEPAPDPYDIPIPAAFDRRKHN